MLFLIFRCQNAFLNYDFYNVINLYKSIEEPVDSNFHHLALASLVHMDLFHRLTPSQIFDLLDKVRRPGLSNVLDPSVLSGLLEAYVPPPRKIVVRNWFAIILSSIFFIYLSISLILSFTRSAKYPQEKRNQLPPYRQARFPFRFPFHP